MILYNSFDQDVLKQYSLDVPKNLSIDESSKVLANIYEKGKLSTMEDFQFALSHAIPMPIMKKKNIKWLIRQRNLTITVFILKKYH